MYCPEEKLINTEDESGQVLPDNVKRLCTPKLPPEVDFLVEQARDDVSVQRELFISVQVMAMELPLTGLIN